MLSKMCDRCGEHYIPRKLEILRQKVNGIMIIDRDNNNSCYSCKEVLDLCPKCLESFDQWLNHKE